MEENVSALLGGGGGGGQYGQIDGDGGSGRGSEGVGGVTGGRPSSLLPSTSLLPLRRLVSKSKQRSLVLSDQPSLNLCFQHSGGLSGGVTEPPSGSSEGESNRQREPE